MARSRVLLDSASLGNGSNGGATGGAKGGANNASSNGSASSSGSGANAGSSSSRDPRAHACAFGKHPAWDDHIEDTGLDHDRLVWIKRVLYSEGIAGNIDSGSWERLDDAKRLNTFNHRFYWRVPEGLVVGRMWSSRDGKGRTKYPMVAAGWVEGTPDAWAVEQVSNKLEAFEKTVKQTSSAELVRLAVGQMQLDLSTSAAVVLGSSSNDSHQLITKLVNSPALDASGQKGLGLMRILYEIERELGTFRNSGTGSFLRGKADAAAPKAQHLRVPAGLDSPSDGVGVSARAWLAIMEQEVGKSTPILVLEPIGEGFVDIVIGEPGPSMLFCTRASAAGLAPTSNVPYSLDPAFLVKAQSRVQGWLDVAMASGKTSGSRGTDAFRGVTKPADSAGRASSSSGTEGDAQKKSKLPLIIGVVALGAAIVVGAVIATSGGKKPETPAQDGVLQSGPGETVTPAPLNSPTNNTVQQPTKPGTDATTTTTTTSPTQQAAATSPNVPISPAQTAPAQTNPTTNPAVPKPAAAVVTLPPPPPAPPAAAVTSADDPRSQWRANERLDLIRSNFGRLSAELSAQGREIGNDVQPRLEKIERQLGLVRSRAFTASEREALARDVTMIDKQIADIEADMQGKFAESRQRVREAVMARSSTPPVQSEPLRRAWTSGLESIDTSIGWTGALERVDQLSNSVKAVESAIQGASFAVPADSNVDAQAVRTGALRRREAALEAAAAGMIAGDQSRVGQIKDELAAWNKSAETLINDASAIERGLARALSTNVPSDTPGANNRSIQDMVAAIEASPAAREIGPAVAPIIASARAVAQIESSNDRVALMAIVAAVPRAGQSPAEAAAAIRQLAVLGAGDGADALAAYTNAMLDGSASLAQRIADPATGLFLTTLAKEGAKESWKAKAPTLASDEPGLRAITAIATRVDATDADVAALPGIAKVNLARLALVDATKVEGTGAQKLTIIRSSIDAFKVAAAAAPEVNSAGLLAALAPIAEAKNDLDLTVIGPASAGWKVASVAEDGSRAAYTWSANGKEHRAEFIRVATQTANGEDAVAYIATTEASAGLVLDLFGQKLGWDNVKTQKALPTIKQGDLDPRRGARVWDWKEDLSQAIISVPRDGNTSLGWLRSKAGMAGVASYPAGNPGVPSGPSADSPMQQIEAISAGLAARLAGCRLPTLSEWEAARTASNASAARANLRDASWKRAFDHLAAIADKNPDLPSDAVFPPNTTKRVSPRDDSAPAVETDDGIVWFAPVQGSGAGVGSNAPGEFMHLIGNVAEFVVVSGTGLSSSAATMDAMKAAMAADQVKVVGGSALSSKEVAMVEAVDSSKRGMEKAYSDVGFRLAFGAPKSAVSASSATKQLEDALAAHGYAKP